MSPAAEARPPALEGRRERNKREKRGRILVAARELFRERGFDAVTTREICARAGIATGTLFLYAKDKRELLFWVFEADARRIFARARRRAPGQGLVEDSCALFGAFIGYYARDRELSRHIVAELLFAPHDPERMGGLTAEYLAVLTELVSRARAAGEIARELPVDAVVASLFAHYAFWRQGWLGARMSGRRAAERGLRSALELAVRGLQSPDVRARRSERP